MALLTRLSALLLACVTLPAAPARAQTGAFVFDGVAWEACFGCGTTTGGFTGTLTGVIGNHVYTAARLTMSYTAYNAAGPTCVLTATANGTMRVSDATRSDEIGFNWTRSYYEIVAISLYGAVNGAAMASYVVTSPVGLPCGGPIEVQMDGVGFGT